MGRNSIVDIATRYGLDGPRIESRWARKTSRHAHFHFPELILTLNNDILIICCSYLCLIWRGFVRVSVSSLQIVYKCIIYIYIYIEREREGWKEGQRERNSEEAQRKVEPRLLASISLTIFSCNIMHRMLE